MKKSTLIIVLFVFKTSFSGQTPLLDAIEKNDTVSFNRILESGYNPNKRKLKLSTRYSISRKRRLPNGKIVIDKRRRRGMPLISIVKTNRPLAEAAWAENYYFVQRLIEKGAKPNKRGNLVLTPLGWAAHRGNLEIVRLLIEKGADINSYEKGTKTTPLIEAIQWKHWTVVKYLIEKGADIDRTDADGKTALNEAATHKNFDLVKILVEKGADVNHVDKKGDCILEDACSDDNLFAEKSSNIEIIKYLVRKGARTDNDALAIALRKGEAEAAKCLIESGAPVLNHLVISASNGRNFELFRYLIDTLGLDINYYDSTLHWGGNVLHGVCSGYWGESSIRKVNIPMLKYILEKGVNVLDTNKRGQTPLVTLLEYGKLDDEVKFGAEILISKKADVNKPGGDLNFSPLMHASSDKLVQTAALLIKAGADVNYSEKRGRSILHWAAWKYNNLEIIKLLAENGANLNARDDWGDTPAQGCIVFGRNENIKLLIELGTDVNNKNNAGYTLLDSVSDPEIIELLKINGAKSGREIK